MSDVVIIAILAALPPTLMALAALVATIKGNTKLASVENKVDGNFTKLLETLSMVSQNSKTVIVEGRRDADKSNSSIENKST